MLETPDKENWRWPWDSSRGESQRIGFELKPLQFSHYEKGFSDIDIKTNAAGSPIEFPLLGEKQHIVAELKSADGDRRLFMCYSLADLHLLFDAYIRNNAERYTVKWHLYSY